MKVIAFFLDANVLSFVLFSISNKNLVNDFHDREFDREHQKFVSIDPKMIDAAEDLPKQREMKKITCKFSFVLLESNRRCLTEDLDRRDLTMKSYLTIDFLLFVRHVSRRNERTNDFVKRREMKRNEPDQQEKFLNDQFAMKPKVELISFSFDQNFQSERFVSDLNEEKNSTFGFLLTIDENRYLFE